MELWIPSQTLDIDNIHMAPFEQHASQKIMVAPIKYSDTNISLNNFITLTPPLEVLFHDIHSGKLVLSLVDHPVLATKLSKLQSYLAMTLFINQQSFFGFVNPLLTAEMFRKMLFPIAYNKKLTIYMGSSAQSVRVYGQASSAGERSGSSCTTGLQSALVQGEKVRIAFQLHGLSILTHPSIPLLQALMPLQTDASGGSICKIRFQQSVKAIYRI